MVCSSAPWEAEGICEVNSGSRLRNSTAEVRVELDCVGVNAKEDEDEGLGPSSFFFFFFEILY
jgi:hypothetical protein